MSELTDRARNLINSNVAPSACQYDAVMEDLLTVINTLCGALDEAADELVDLNCKAILESDGEKYRSIAKQHKQKA